MKKNNARNTKQSIKKDLKNKERKKRAAKQREWHHLVAQVKFMQDYMKKTQEAVEAKKELDQNGENNPDLSKQ